MRKKKHTGDRIQACADYMNYTALFKQNKLIYLEIGCGKGDFICGTAQKFPEVNFIAIEKMSDIIVTALEKAKSLNLSNVRFIITDAKKLEEYFAEYKISQIYLNFSDPWHKRYQADKRLTSPVFLEIYKKILTPNAKIIMKTDNINLFDYSLKTFPANGFTLKNITRDLYNSDFFNFSENIQTEYEKNFVSQNKPICYLEAYM